MSVSNVGQPARSGSEGQIKMDDLMRFELCVRACLFDSSVQKKVWIIGVLLEIENKENISVHLHLSDVIMQELKKATHARCKDLRIAAVQFFTTVLDVEANNVDYLTAQGIIQHYIGLLSTQDKDVFTSLVRGLEVFLDFPQSLDKLVGVGLVESLLSSFKESRNQTIHSESLCFLAKYFHSLGVPLASTQAQNAFDVFFDFAATRMHRLNGDLLDCVLKFCKYLFRVDLHQIFTEKANIVHIFELYQGFPKLLRTVVNKLAQRPQVMKRIVHAQVRYFFELIKEVLPTAAVTLTLALMELLRAMLEYEPKCVLEVWREADIMDQLRGNLSIEKDLTINILQIYSLLITHPAHAQITSCIPDVAEAVIEAIANERTVQAVEKGLRVVERILEFEARGYKSGSIKERAFTHALRTSTEGGSVLEQISLRTHQRFIRNLAQRILGRNFVKIEGRILSIDSVCRKMSEEVPIA